MKAWSRFPFVFASFGLPGRELASSVALNIAEGSGSHGGTRTMRYRTALGSARETGACLDVAMALGYLDQLDAELLSKLDQVRAMLAKLVG
jgi:four helix bundle protein